MIGLQVGRWGILTIVGRRAVPRDGIKVGVHRVPSVATDPTHREFPLRDSSVNCGVILLVLIDLSSPGSGERLLEFHGDQRGP